MHENEKQQSVEQGNSMTNRGDRRKREETCNKIYRRVANVESFHQNI